MEENPWKLRRNASANCHLKASVTLIFTDDKLHPLLRI